MAVLYSHDNVGLSFYDVDNFNERLNGEKPTFKFCKVTVGRTLRVTNIAKKLGFKPTQTPFVKQTAGTTRLCKLSKNVN